MTNILTRVCYLTMMILACLSRVVVVAADSWWKNLKGTQVEDITEFK